MPNMPPVSSMFSPLKRVGGLLGDIWESQNTLQKMGLLPIVGDAAGFAGDVQSMVQNPEERTLGNAALTGLGLLPFVPAGLGMVKKLPMDEASRMARAKEFNVSGYHGTGNDITEFDRPVWMSESPDLANEYADMRFHTGGSPGVMPLVAKSGRSVDADKLPKTLTVGSFMGGLAKQAKSQGIDVDEGAAKELMKRIKKGARAEESGPHYSRHDFWYQPTWQFGDDGASALNEFYKLLGIDSISMTERGAKTFGILNPRNVRSKFAAFDPAKSDSANILATMAGMGLLGAYAYPQDQAK